MAQTLAPASSLILPSFPISTGDVRRVLVDPHLAERPDTRQQGSASGGRVPGRDATVRARPGARAAIGAATRLLWSATLESLEKQWTCTIGGSNTSPDSEGDAHVLLASSIDTLPQRGTVAPGGWPDCPDLADAPPATTACVAGR